MKAADISDEAFLSAVRQAIQLRGEFEECEWMIGATRWDLAAVLTGHPEDVAATPVAYPELPEQVLLAKARALIDRGLLDGCACGCRGDFIPARGRATTGVEP